MSLIRIAAFVVAISGVLSGQVAFIDESNPSLGFPNATPWAQTNLTTLHVYHATQLAEAGICPGATLLEIAIAPSDTGLFVPPGPPSGTFSATQARMTIGNLMSSPPIAGLWESNFQNPVVVHGPQSGPLTFPWTRDTWTPIPGVASAGFTWDGTTDFGIYLSLGSVTSGPFWCHASSSNLVQSVGQFAATTAMPGLVQFGAMNVRLTFASGGTTFQVNQPAAGMDIDGVTGSTCRPATNAFDAGSTRSLNLSGQALGMPWDMAITSPETSVAVGAGGLLLPSGQIVNIDLAAGSLSLLGPAGGFTPTSLPLVLPETEISLQMIVIDPMQADGFALSQAIDLITACANPQGFEGLTSGAYPTLWSDGGGNAEWRIQSGPTPSAGTGPTTSTGSYMYCETSSFTGAATFVMDSCLFDTSGLSNPTLSFSLSRIGADIGTLTVRQDDGSGTFPFSLLFFNGPDPAQSQGGLEWTTESVPLNPSAMPRFRFSYVAGGGFLGDIAIDQVGVN